MDNDQPVQEDQPRRYLITLRSGASHETRDPMTKTELHDWLNTGAAGILYPNENVRILPDDIALIQPIKESEE